MDLRIHKGRKVAHIYVRGWPGEDELTFLNSFYEALIASYPHEVTVQWTDFVDGWHTLDQDVTDVQGLIIKKAHVEKVKIIGIDDSLCQLEGKLPEFSRLKYLTVLDLANNKIHGEIPASIQECQALSQLLLQHNNLTGCIPENIGECTKMTNIVLDNNDLSGPIPTSI